MKIPHQDDAWSWITHRLNLTEAGKKVLDNSLIVLTAIVIGVGTYVHFAPIVIVGIIVAFTTSWNKYIRFLVDAWRNYQRFYIFGIYWCKKCRKPKLRKHMGHYALLVTKDGSVRIRPCLRCMKELNDMGLPDDRYQLISGITEEQLGLVPLIVKKPKATKVQGMQRRIFKPPQQL